MITFGSDTMAPAFPEVLDALAAVNHGEEPSYGDDSVTRRVAQTFCEMLDTDVEVRWALGGTGANVIAMLACVQRHESIVLADVAHMVEYEAGAVQQATGAQFHTISTKRDAKLAVENIEPVVKAMQHPHCSQPRVLSLTQATDRGTTYATDEVRSLSELAHEYDMYVHIDGARIANALATRKVSAKEFLTETGVDIVSFGASKGGTMIGDAVVVLNSELREDIHTKHVSSGNLPAKARYIAAQYEAFFADNRWLDRAHNANSQAFELREAIAELEGYDVWPGDVNMVFATAPDGSTQRWVTAWNTTASDVDEVVARLR